MASKTEDAKIENATGFDLDLLVANAIGQPVTVVESDGVRRLAVDYPVAGWWAPNSTPGQAAELLEKYRVALTPKADGEGWFATRAGLLGRTRAVTGQTMAEAGLRAIVLSLN